MNPKFFIPRRKVPNISFLGSRGFPCAKPNLTSHPGRRRGGGVGGGGCGCDEAAGNRQVGGAGGICQSQSDSFREEGVGPGGNPNLPTICVELKPVMILMWLEVVRGGSRMLPWAATPFCTQLLGGP